MRGRVDRERGHKRRGERKEGGGGRRWKDQLPLSVAKVKRQYSLLFGYLSMEDENVEESIQQKDAIWGNTGGV